MQFRFLLTFLSLVLLTSAFSFEKSQASLVLHEQFSTTHSSQFQTSQQTGTRVHYRKFILNQLYGDLTYLIGERDFYLVAGGIFVGPETFEHSFKTESNSLGEMWGQSAFADHFFEAGEILGDVAFPLVASASSWGIGKMFGSEKLQNFGYDLIRAQAMNGLMTVSIKGIINRTRPDGAPYSYPSGHTSSAFTTAGVVYRNFGKGWGIPAFAIASFVGVSRLQENKHFVSDIAAGAVLGTYLSLKISGHQTDGSKIYLTPYDIHQAQGLALGVKF